MVTYEEAKHIIKSVSRSFGQEIVSLDKAYGRILAESVRADRDYPPFDRAAMDGFAVRLSDWESGLRDYEVQETIYAGEVRQADLVPGSCYKIMTGAAVPLHANAIIRREDCWENGHHVQLDAKSLTMYQNISRKGEDVQEGEMVLEAPTCCTPSVISSLAAIGKDEVLVERLPTVALFTTGDEIMPVENSVSAVQIRNSNKHLLKALLHKFNLEPCLCQHIPDNKEQLKAILGIALEQNIIIISGGVSAGDADFVPEVLQELGMVKLFHKVAIRPGKPVLFGQLPAGGVVFALPENPFSCLVTFTLFVELYLTCCSGLSVRPAYQLPLLQKRLKKSRLTEFFTVKMAQDAQGLCPLSSNGSGDFRAGLAAHGLAIHAAETEVLEEGALVKFFPL